jgi:hypothetical protein
VSDDDPLVENAFAHELRVFNSLGACPWRNGHPCHLAGKKSLGVDPFKRCLLCLLGEILRELEVRRLNR